ncbi:hypothetical protein PMI22_04831 [Pseudomonas sp. GM21]|nr:hypothetical protein PMI22_04831 [Pseudomonas sp. GM21]
MAKTGRPPRVMPEHYPIVVSPVRASPLSSQAGLMELFLAETGISCHSATFAAALKLAGVVRIKPKLKREFEPPARRKE